MKCKHCEYETGLCMKDGKLVNLHPPAGHFYRSPVELVRSPLYLYDERESLYGCQNCGKVFIDVIGGVTNEY